MTTTTKYFKKLTLFIVATIAVILLIAWTLDSFGSEAPFLLCWHLACHVLDCPCSQVVPLSFSSAYYDFKSFEQTVKSTSVSVFDCSRNWFAADRLRFSALRFDFQRRKLSRLSTTLKAKCEKPKQGMSSLS